MRQYLMFSVILTVGIFIGAGIQNMAFAGTLFWGYWNSETAIGAWLGQGVDPISAALLGFVMGGLFLSHAWALTFVNWDVPTVVKIKAWLEYFVREKLNEKEKLAQSLPKTIIALAGFSPGLFILGLAIAVAKSIKRSTTLAMLLLGHGLKCCVASALFLGAMVQFPWLQKNLLLISGVILVGLVIIPLTYKAIDLKRALSAIELVKD